MCEDREREDGILNCCKKTRLQVTPGGPCKIKLSISHYEKGFSDGNDALHL